MDKNEDAMQQASILAEQVRLLCNCLADQLGAKAGEAMTLTNVICEKAAEIEKVLDARLLSRLQKKGKA